MSARKKSEVWEHFTEDENTVFAICKHCFDKVKRGKDLNNRKSWSASPLWTHLQRHHPTEHKEATGQRALFEKHAKRRKTEEYKRGNIYVQGTPVLPEYLKKRTKYSNDNEEQKELTKLLGEWIADGVLPYELVDNIRYEA